MVITQPMTSAGFQPPRALTPAQRRIVATIYQRNLLDYQLIAAELGRAPRTVKMHVEQIALLLPGKGKPLFRVALYAERLLVPISSTSPEGLTSDQ